MATTPYEWPAGGAGTKAERALSATHLNTHTAAIAELQAMHAAQALGDAANIAWNLATGGYATVTLGGNRTLDNPTNLTAGARYTLTVTQDATGTRTLGYGNAYKFPGAVPPVLTSTANAVDVLEFVSDGAVMRLVNFAGDLR